MAVTDPVIYQPVSLDRRGLVLKAYEAYGNKYPDIYPGYNEYQKARTLEDFSYHLQYLEEALAIGDAAIFIDYAKWAHVLLSSLGLPKDCLSLSLEVLRDLLNTELPTARGIKSDEYITETIAVLASAPTTIPSFIKDDHPLSPVAHEYLNALLNADREQAYTLVLAQFNAGVPARDLYLHVFQPVLHETGRLWQMHKISIAHEHYVTASTQQILARLYTPFIGGSKYTRRNGKTLVAACVESELHEVGMRMVADFFEMDGWNTYYIGANTPSRSIIETVKDRKASAVALSSTMSFHIPQLYSIIRSLRETHETADVTIIVGGYPFNLIPTLWRTIGADAYASSAEEAVIIANQLTGSRDPERS
jgi:methanogenic corrinoid protein MtbC1